MLQRSAGISADASFDGPRAQQPHPSLQSTHAVGTPTTDGSLDIRSLPTHLAWGSESSTTAKKPLRRSPVALITLHTMTTR